MSVADEGARMVAALLELCDEAGVGCRARQIVGLWPGDEVPETVPVLPDHSIRLSSVRVDDPPPWVLKAEEEVLRHWGHLIDEGVMTETGLRCIAASAAHVAMGRDGDG
jgi:hypothetical protein